MKKNLLTLFALAGLISAANAQWYQTGGTVKVESNTLKHVSGVQKISGTDSKETNKGNVYVGGNFTVEGTGTEFRNVWTNGTTYGQLIVDEDATSSIAGTGTVVGEFKDTAASQFYTQPIAVPFTDVTASDLATQTGIMSPEFNPFTTANQYDANRYKNPILTWNNENYRLDIVDDTADNLDPKRSYNINNGYYGLAVRTSNYKGTPANGKYTYSGTGFTVADNTTTNYYGEALYTYLDDLTQAMPVGWNTSTTVTSLAGINGQGIGYAANVFRFANPYTSNIDLGKVITGGGEVTNVFQFSGNTYASQASATDALTSVMTTNWNGTTWAGNGVETLLVRPFHTFGLKTNTSQGNSFSIEIGDNVKTWEATGAMSYVNRTSNNSNLLTQVKLELHNNIGKINHCYVDAADGYAPAAGNNNESYQIYLGDRDGIFTLQENADGTVSAELAHNRVYTNGINKRDYVGLPVHVVHQVATPGEYTFKAELSGGLLAGGGRFFFEDTLTGEIMEITSGFNYTFTAQETSDDRFNVYWNDVPNSLAVNDIANNIDTTKVYKDDSVYKVRFAKSTTDIADVYIYSPDGKLVHVAKGVETSTDYVLPLIDKISSAYIVKIVDENGVESTKKIIK